MAIKKGLFCILLFLISGQISATLISAGTQQVKNVSVGSDDVLQSVDLTKSDPDYDLIDEGREADETSTTILESSSSVSSTSETSSSSVTSESSSSTMSSIVSSTTETVSTTALPKKCDKVLETDTELIFPPKDHQFDKDFEFSWCFELKDGPGIDIYLDYLNIDPQTDYILIMSGHDDEDEDEKGQLITGTQSNLTFKIIHTNKALIHLLFKKKENPENYGFKIIFSSHGEHPPTTTPPSTTLPSMIGKMKTVTKSLSVPREIQNDTEIWDKTLRNALVESTILWREKHNFTDYLEKPDRSNVIFERISPCPISWPDHANCVRVEFGVPLNETDFDGDRPEDLNAEYELTEEHLEEMWNEFAVEKLALNGMYEYQLPNSTQVLLIWISICVAIVIVFCIVLYAIWKSDLFKDYKRMDEEPEIQKSSEEEQNHHDISMFADPFLFGADAPPEGMHDYEHHDMTDQDTTLYDVRSQREPPTIPVKPSVKFAANVENIEDARSVSYTNPFALELEASESGYGFRDSEC